MNEPAWKKGKFFGYCGRGSKMTDVIICTKMPDVLFSCMKVSSSSILSKCLMTHKANIFTYLQQRLDFSVEAPPLPIPQFQIGSTIALQNSNGIELLSAFHIIPAKKIRLTFIIPKSLASSNFQSQEAYSIISFLKRGPRASSPDAYLAFYHAISSRLVRTRTSQLHNVWKLAQNVSFEICNFLTILGISNEFCKLKMWTELASLAML